MTVKLFSALRSVARPASANVTAAPTLSPAGARAGQAAKVVGGGPGVDRSAIGGAPTGIGHRDDDFYEEAEPRGAGAQNCFTLRPPRLEDIFNRPQGPTSVPVVSDREIDLTNGGSRGGGADHHANSESSVLNIFKKVLLEQAAAFLDALKAIVQSLGGSAERNESKGSGDGDGPGSGGGDHSAHGNPGHGTQPL
ncbi:hypothetical protein ACLESD_27710 [Pyxidicoccus sp. 3LFB2]